MSDLQLLAFNNKSAPLLYSLIELLRGAHMEEAKTQRGTTLVIHNKIRAHHLPKNGKYLLETGIVDRRR